MLGLFTPTEAGSVGLFCVLVITIAKGDINFKGVKESVNQALRTSVMIIILITASTMLGHFIAVTDIPNNIAEILGSLPLNRNVIL